MWIMFGCSPALRNSVSDRDSFSISSVSTGPQGRIIFLANPYMSEEMGSSYHAVEAHLTINYFFDLGSYEMNFSEASSRNYSLMRHSDHPTRRPRKVIHVASWLPYDISQK